MDIQGIPILTSHIGPDVGDNNVAIQQNLLTHGGNEDRSQLGGHLLGANDNHRGDCFLSSNIHQHQPCGCEHDEWGCGGKHVHVPHPNEQAILGAQSQLTATIIPAQVLVSNATTVTNGTQCEESVGFRRRNDTEKFITEGNFQVSKFDCQENCLSEASCFLSKGEGKEKFCASEADHPIDPCECNSISTNDLLDLEQHCDCRIFENKRKAVQDIADPEADVEKRINHEIKRTIADILSEIVQNVFHQSFEEIIQID